MKDTATLKTWRILKLAALCDLIRSAFFEMISIRHPRIIVHSGYHFHHSSRLCVLTVPLLYPSDFNG